MIKGVNEMKKIIVALMTVVIIIGVLTGCSGKSSYTYSTPIPEQTSSLQETSKQFDLSKTENDMTETVNGHLRFKISRTEFISRYNMLADELSYDEIKISSNNQIPNDTAHVKSIFGEYGGENAYEYAMGNHREHLVILVDKDDKIMLIQFVDMDTYGNNNMDNSNNWYRGVEIIYRTMIDKTVSHDDYQTELISKLQNGITHVTNSTWQWGFREDRTFLVSINDLFK